MGYSVINDHNIITYIDPEGNDTSQPLNVSIGTGTYQRQKQLCVGNMELRDRNTADNYDKGETTLNYSAEGNWIKIGKDAENINSTAAPIVYTSFKNEGDDERQVELTLAGNGDNKITIIQKPVVRLLYMVKETNEQYGDWIECMKINRSGKISYNQPPLTSVQDISIFNGRANNTYNDIIVELQPYRNMNISFAFSQDNTLDKIIKSKYSLEVVKDSTFINNETYNTENGYFSFSTNNQNSWTKKTIGGGGDGIAVDVSSHYRIKPNSGINLPNIDFYISNMLSYRIITSYNVKIKCEQGGECFIQTAYVDGFENNAQNWPSRTGDSIILENCMHGKNILLTYPEAIPEQGGFTVNVSQLLNLKYSISIEGYKYIDYDGTQKYSNQSLPIDIRENTNILTIIKTWREGGTVEVSALIRFISTSSTNKQTFVKAEPWPSNISLLNQGWAINLIEAQQGIYIRLTSSEWRFFNAGSVSQETTIGFLSI